MKELTIKCPDCNVEYDAVPKAELVQCMDYGRVYFQILEVINFCENWIKQCFYRVKG